tara:strand:+ start:1288 stop:1467 length:180 start_codon:yes stop_codon:yes gene_type:complete
MNNNQRIEIIKDIFSSITNKYDSSSFVENKAVLLSFGASTLYVARKKVSSNKRCAIKFQ